MDDIGINVVGGGYFQVAFDACQMFMINESIDLYFQPCSPVEHSADEPI